MACEVDQDISENCLSTSFVYTSLPESRSTETPILDLLSGRSTFEEIYFRGDLLSGRDFQLFPQIYFRGDLLSRRDPSPRTAGRASRPGPWAGPPGTGKEDLLKKHVFGVKNENRRFGAIFGRVWPQLGQNRNQREKLVIEMVL